MRNVWVSELSPAFSARMDGYTVRIRSRVKQNGETIAKGFQMWVGWQKHMMPGTLRYFMRTRWNGINQRTINGRNPSWNNRFARFYLEKGIRLEMAREEFYGWCISNWHIARTIQSKGMTASVDRIDSNGPYSLENIQIISRNENSRAKGLTGPNFVYANEKATKIKATHIETGKTFIGTRRDLAKKLNMAFSSVTACAGGILNSCKGYRFEYAEKIDPVLYKRIMKAAKVHQENARNG